jgi:hypothetical protein
MRTLVVIVVAAVATVACGGGDTPTSPSRSPRSGIGGTTNSALGTASPVDRLGVPGVAMAARSCSAVANGTELMAAGTSRSDGVVVATHLIRVQSNASGEPATLAPMPSAPPPGSAAGTRLSIAARGIASNVSGACPDLRLTLGEQTVVTNAATAFYGL